MSALNDVRTTCWDTSRQLWALLNDPTLSPEAQRAADLEFIEVNHRLAITQGRCLAAEVTGELKTSAAAVSAARAQVQKVLANVESASEVITGVSKFLTAVDGFIDAAKPFFV